MAEVKEAHRPRTAATDVEGRATKIGRRSTTAPSPRYENPIPFMCRIAEEIERLFDDFGLRVPQFVGRSRELLRREIGLIPAERSPRIDVRERGGQLVVRADLPGLSKDDLQVDITDDSLTIRGERKQEKKQEREGYSYSECSYGSFYRAIPLPEGVNPSKATTLFNYGVLEVAMPVPGRREPQARRLDVREKR
jgi:HSP20 family protein